MSVEEIIIAGQLTAIAALGTLIYLHHKSQEELLKTFWLSAICLVLFYSFSVLYEGLQLAAATASMGYTLIVIQVLAVSFFIIMLLAFFHLLQLIWTWFVGSFRKLMGDRMQ